MRIIGIDPGLRTTGWGIVDLVHNRLTYVAHGLIRSTEDGALSQRLHQLYAGLCSVLETWKPQGAAMEEVFVNVNPRSTLKLGMARGSLMLAPARFDLEVHEYAPNLVKKSLVGSGHATKDQMQAMLKYLLPKAQGLTADAADALAVAICHAHHLTTTQQWRSAS